MSLRCALFLICFLLAFHCGCSSKETSRTPDEADQKFLKILKDEFEYQVIIKWVGNTLWVYSPGERPVWRVAMKEDSPSGKMRKYTLLYLDGYSQNKMFTIEYDIVPTTKFLKSDYPTPQYTEALEEEYRNILGSVTQTYVDSQRPPVFVVMVFADIKNGLEIRNTFCLEDLKRSQSGLFPAEEFSLRILSESKSDKDIILDYDGDHVKYQEIEWPDFLIKQVIQRINFKYFGSEFEPTDEPPLLILKTFAQTMRYYDFTDFISVNLVDLRNNTGQTFHQWELSEYHE